MSRIRTLSRVFMKGHPRAGSPTHFYEKVLNSLQVNYRHPNIASYLVDLNLGKELEISSFLFDSDINYKIEDAKPHTIRMGRHFKPVDELTLGVWSGSLYNYNKDGSKIIKLWAGEIRAVNIEIYRGIHQPLIISQDEVVLDIDMVAKNDGLSTEDFKAWFMNRLKAGHHEAQILIWNKQIQY